MQSSESDHEVMRRWVSTWKGAGEELDRIKQQELRALTEEEAAAQSHDRFRMGDRWMGKIPAFNARAAW